jgi:hypothetical protein
LRFLDIRRRIAGLLEARMTFSWLSILACIFLLGFLFFHRTPAGEPTTLSRLALLHGIRPLWGESEASVRQRTTGAGRWPYSKPEPKFVWWARAWHRAIGVRRD